MKIAYLLGVSKYKTINELQACENDRHQKGALT